MGVRAGGSYENPPRHSIKNGRLMLKQEEICDFLGDVIQRIKQNCHPLLDNHSVKV